MRVSLDLIFGLALFSTVNAYVIPSRNVGTDYVLPSRRIGAVCKTRQSGYYYRPI